MAALSPLTPGKFQRWSLELIRRAVESQNGFRNSLGGLLRYGLGGLDLSLLVSFELWSEFGGKACFFAVAPGGDVADFFGDPIEITQASPIPSARALSGVIRKSGRTTPEGVDFGLVFVGSDIVR